MGNDVRLREVTADDLPIFFEQQLDPEANHMAAFTPKDPTDRAAYMARWTRNLGDARNIHRTILCDGQVAGSVSSYVDEEGRPEVTYWLGKEFWGQGIATEALTAFLELVNTARPIYARAAKDNLASLCVLQKCGFAIIGEDAGFANARGAVIEEYLLRLEAAPSSEG
jgi:RimJ/RimL family protein N-acetyltransferase